MHRHDIAWAKLGSHTSLDHCCLADFAFIFVGVGGSQDRSTWHLPERWHLGQVNWRLTEGVYEMKEGFFDIAVVRAIQTANRTFASAPFFLRNR